MFFYRYVVVLLLLVPLATTQFLKGMEILSALSRITFEKSKKDHELLSQAPLQEQFYEAVFEARVEKARLAIDNGMTLNDWRVTNNTYDTVAPLVFCVLNLTQAHEHAQRLHITCEQYQQQIKEIVKLLLDNGADPYTQNIKANFWGNWLYGNSVLNAYELACWHGQGDLVESMMRSSLGNVSSQVPSFVKSIAILDTEKAKNLAGKLVNVRVQKGQETMSLLTLVVSELGDVSTISSSMNSDENEVRHRLHAVIDVLLTRGADPNLIFSSGYNALHQAALIGDLALIQKLMRLRANLQIKVTGSGPDKGKRAYELALTRQHADVAQYLEQCCASVGPKNKYSRVTYCWCAGLIIVLESMALFLAQK